MINKQRVQRFRTLIQLVIVLLVVVPVIMIIALCVRMMGMLGDMTAYLERLPVTSASSGAGLAPENQSFTNQEGRAPSTASRAESGEPATTEPATAPKPIEVTKPTEPTQSAEPPANVTGATEATAPTEAAEAASPPPAQIVGEGPGQTDQAGDMNGNPVTGL